MTEAFIDWTAITIAAIASTLFFLLWAIFAPWYKTAIGRALVFSELSLAVLLDISVLAHWWGWLLPNWVATAIFIFIAVTAVLRVNAGYDLQVKPWVMQTRLYRRARRRR